MNNTETLSGLMEELANEISNIEKESNEEIENEISVTTDRSIRG